MFKKLTLITLAVSLLSGCASVPMKNRSVSDQAKAFPTPSQGNAGIYIYRLGGLGHDQRWQLKANVAISC